MSRVRTLMFSAPFLLLLASAAAVAQGTDTSTGLSQMRRGESGDQKGGNTSVVHAGAGTSSATTTGYSGKPQQGSEGSSSKPPGQIDVPPLPDASLCEPYKGGPAHDGCLQIVLRQKGAAQ